MADQRDVAGLFCADVLERLSDYLDGELPDKERARVEAHLRGCDWCEKFGGEFTTLIATLRRDLARPPALDAGVAERLRERLRAATKA